MGNLEFKHIIDNIKNRRLELGYTYQDLADKTGMSKSTLQRYETGFIKNLSIDKLELLAKALNVDPAYLMGWESSLPDIEEIYEHNLKNNEHPSDERRAYLGKSHQSEFQKLTIKNELLAAKILSGELTIDGYTTEFLEGGRLGKIIARKNDFIWHLGFFLPFIDPNATDMTYRRYFSLGYVLNFYQKIIMYTEPVTKFTIVVQDENLFNRFLQRKPNNLSIEVSVMLIDLDNYKIVQELTLNM